MIFQNKFLTSRGACDFFKCIFAIIGAFKKKSYSKTIFFLWQAPNFIWGQCIFPNFHFSHSPSEGTPTTAQAYSIFVQLERQVDEGIRMKSREGEGSVLLNSKHEWFTPKLVEVSFNQQWPTSSRAQHKFVFSRKKTATLVCVLLQSKS